MKLVYIAKEAWEENYFKEKLPEVEVVPAGDASAEALCVFVDHPVGAADMARYPNLKLIATRSTGYDHIDLAEATRRGITVATVPSYGVNTVAEFAFALILALSRRVADARARVAAGSFSQEGLQGFDLAGKTLGVVGCGRIGVHTATIGKGFGMEVLVYDPTHDEALAQKIGFAYADLPDLLSRADIVSLHAPYNEHTHHLINRDTIKQMKRGAYLINTARGALVETEALVEALKSGALAGAGLDVLEEEGDMHDEAKLLAQPHPKEEELRVVLENHYLMSHPRVIVTPHVAFDTEEAVRRILDTTIENVAAFMRGEPQNTPATKA
jgi:D-lactate dehydrogenase